MSATQGIILIKDWLLASIPMTTVVWLAGAFIAEASLPFFPLAIVLAALFVGVVMGIWVPASLRMITYYVALVGFILTCVGNFLMPSVIIVSLAGFFLGMVIGFSIDYFKNNWNIFWFGIALGGILITLGLPSLVYMIVSIVGAILSIVGSFYERELNSTTNTILQLHNDWVVNSMAYMMVIASSVLLSILILWLAIYSPQLDFINDQMHLATLAIFVGTMYAMAQNLKLNWGLVFVGALFTLFAVGMAFTFSIPFLFAAIVAVGIYLSIAGFYQLFPSFIFSKLDLTILAVFLAVSNVGIAIHLASYESFLISIDMPAPYLLKSEIQHIIKITTTPAALMVIGSGVIFMKRRGIELYK